MKKILLFFILGVFLLNAQNYSAPLKTNEWIRNWLLCGPIELNQSSNGATDYSHISGFDTDYLKAHGGETNLKVKAGQIERINGKNVQWFTYTSDDSIINLDKAVSKKSEVAVYGYCEIIALKDTLVMLSFGSNDGARIWLNGERIWDYYEPRGLKADDDRIPVVLHKGKNKLLLKVEERGGSWAFCARFKALNFNDINPFNVKTNDDGAAYAASILPKSALNIIFPKILLQLFPYEDQTKAVWRKEWKENMQQPIYPQYSGFSKFILRIEAKGYNGQSWLSEQPLYIGKWHDYTLFEKGKSAYKIVLGTDASESEQWAAQEMQRLIKKASGAVLPIIKDNKKQGKKEIIIGYNKHCARLLGEAKKPEDKDESFIYKNIGPSLLIYGGALRGTMYGVFTFLERELGCRWYTPAVTLIPKKERYVFNYLYQKEAPAVRVRNDFYYEAFNPIWAAHNKINGAMGYREQPGDVEAYWSVHTFSRLMPPDEFFKDHPEYYSLIDGERTTDHTQLCLTNPDVLKIITQRVKQVMRDNPQYLIYSVSQNDWHNPCECENCQAIVKKEQSEAGLMIWFVNQVAQNVEKEVPNKYIGTLAYQYTRTPPAHVKPRKNVVVRLCSIECCFAHDFVSCPQNQAFLSDLRRWAQISPHLYIWDYVVNFSHYIMPYPNFGVLKSNIRTLRDNKAIGIMEQGAYQSRGGEFAELRAYLLAKLLWNPETDQDEIINDFMYGYYGRSGRYVRQYFDYLQKQVTPQTHIHLGLRPDDPIFSDEFVRRSEELFDKAEKVADNKEILRRVEVARLPIMYLKCKRMPVMARYDGTYERFNEIVKREGITHYAEEGETHKKRFEQNVENAK